MKMSMTLAVTTLVALCLQGAPVEVKILGDWQLQVSINGINAILKIEPAEQIAVVDEKIEALPLYNPRAAQYSRGWKLAGVRCCECTVRYAMDPDSLVVRTAPNAEPLVRGKDYETELSWGCLGRLEGGAIGQQTAVFVSYRYGKMRLDSVVLTDSGKIELCKGASHLSLPQPPMLQDKDTRLGNIWVCATDRKLNESMLFPIMETRYPETDKASPAIAEQLLPKTMAKLQSGGTLRILAWGDSVTHGGYLPDYKKTRWQAQFLRRLQKKFPQAEITLMTEAWGGRNTASYFNEPPGSEHNYDEKVLALKPDLVISEFVNDANLNEAVVYERYGRIRDDFKKIGAEWIIMTPHYVRPDWMGLTSQKQIDDDPRAYVKAVRKFASENDIAVAEGSLRYGRLWRQGIPYLTLMMNNINHPNPYGMSLFADALSELFP